MKPNVLIVDGDYLTRRNISSILDQEGYCLYEAEDQEDARHIILSNKIDIALLDLRSLKSDALSLLQSIKDVHSDAEIILLTSSKQIALAIQGMKLGAFDDLLIPVDVQQLLSQVGAAWKNKRKKARGKRRKIMEKFKVLLVDDEEEFVKSLSERLQLRELNSDLAFDGEQALQLVSDEVPDVMVLDLRMPGIDGMEVLRRVKKKYPQVQVVILTGHGDEKDEVQAKKLGAYAYLQKPVDLDTLVDVLKKAFKNKVESSMTAAAFAEAGEFDTARKIMDDENS